MATRINELYFRVKQELGRKRKNKSQTHEAIDADLEAFLEHGGLIQQCAQGETGDQDLREGFRRYSRFHEKERRGDR